MHVKACKKTALGCVWVAKRRRANAFGLQKGGTRRRLGGGKSVCGCVWAMERRCTAAFERWKDGMRQHFACNNTARSGVWVVERWHGAAFGRHCACKKTACGTMCAATGVLPRSLQCAKTRSHARKAPCTYTSHAAPKHVPMQEKHLAHAIL